MLDKVAIIDGTGREIKTYLTEIINTISDNESYFLNIKITMQIED